MRIRHDASRARARICCCLCFVWCFQWRRRRREFIPYSVLFYARAAVLPLFRDSASHSPSFFCVSLLISRFLPLFSISLAKARRDLRFHCVWLAAWLFGEIMNLVVALVFQVVRLSWTYLNFLRLVVFSFRACFSHILCSVSLFNAEHNGKNYLMTSWLWLFFRAHSRIVFCFVFALCFFCVRDSRFWFCLVGSVAFLRARVAELPSRLFAYLPTYLEITTTTKWGTGHRNSCMHKCFSFIVQRIIYFQTALECICLSLPL